MAPEASENQEHPLAGGGRTAVARQGDTVLRQTGEWAPTVHALLRHLETVGFEAAPHVVGSGFDTHGRETLSYIEGEFVHPAPWSDEGLIEVGLLMRRLHDATASFVPPLKAQWQSWFLRDIGEGQRIIGHGDAAPWNTVTKKGLPIGLIDWEYAGPVSRLTEVARVCWLFAQLHDDDVAQRVELPSLNVRARQLRLLVDAYGLTAPERHLLFETIVGVAICETANEAVENQVTPESQGALWGFAWRARAAAWMLRHRRILENVLR